MTGEVQDHALVARAGTVLFPYLRALAHDMAGPLTITLGTVQLSLRLLPKGAEWREDFQDIESATEKLRGFTGNLSRLSRYLPEEREDSAQELVDDLEYLTGSVARRSGVPFDFIRRGQTRPFLVKGNPWLLRAGCLAVLGSAVGQSGARVECDWSDDHLTLRLVGAEQTEAGWPRPDQAGCFSLGVELLASQGAKIATPGGNPEITLVVAEDSTDG